MSRYKIERKAFATDLSMA